MSEHPPELVEKVRDELAGWPIGNGYYGTKVGTDEALGMARAVLDAIGLEPEIQTNVPVSVPTFDADGQPVMNDCGHQHHHSDWVDRERLVTPWVETGRVTGEQMRQRIDAYTAEVAERLQPRITVKPPDRGTEAPNA